MCKYNILQGSFMTREMLLSRGFIFAPVIILVFLVIAAGTGAVVLNRSSFKAPETPRVSEVGKKTATDSARATPSAQTANNTKPDSGKNLNKENPKSVPNPSATTTNSTPNSAPSNTGTTSQQNQNSGSIVVDKSNVTVSLYKDQAVNSLIFGTGFKIMSTGATGWQIKYDQPTSGQGFYESSGGISSNGSADVRAYINASKPNGVYSGSAIVQYQKNGQWFDGPRVSYTITLFGPATPATNITVDKTSVSVTLDRTGIQTGQLIYGSGFTITSQTATGWEIKYNEATSGQGFYESSGGINPGSSTNIRTYINTNKTNGTYTGSAIVRYEKNGTWYDGPTVSYSIVLTGTTPSSTPEGCTPVTFSTSKSGSVTTVAVSGAWNLSVKSTPQYDSVDFDTANRIIYLRFSTTSGTVNVHTANYTGAPLCQSYNFSN